MIPSRSVRSNSTNSNNAKEKQKKGKPELEDFINDRDYSGAITLLEFTKKSDTDAAVAKLNLEWLAYAAFHYGDYKKALDIYTLLLEKDKEKEPEQNIITVYIGCCHFYLGNFKEAEQMANSYQGDPNQLQIRLLFHLSQKSNNEEKLMHYHQKLKYKTEDQLSLASVHYLRQHYQEAIDVYKGILVENKDFLALNVYVALCYYKLDYYDVSQEVLSVYLQSNPYSAIAINLKACNYFRVYNGKSAEAELKQLSDASFSGGANFGADLMAHNMVVFRNGENALQVLPPLLDTIPEARLNLVIYYLRNDDVHEAYNLIKDLEPSSPQEYTLKGVVNAAYGQIMDSREHLKIAQQYFQLVGSSPSECDTIPGRQCMASCFFILKQFEDVLIYLTSIKSYFQQDDDFNWNFGIAKASCGEYKEAEEALHNVQSEKYKSDYCYLSWLARCYIMNGKARQAWELYLKMESSSESFNLLQIIANDCYKTGAFFYSAKAFGVLEHLESTQENWSGKKNACLGVFRQVVAGQESKETLRDIVTLLRNDNNSNAENIIRVITKWAKENGFKILS